jgi:hypothetical protein
MAFGQSPGPPASQRQVQRLLVLLQDAGHRDFRDARGPMGFTQRQAGGKFTRDEAEALIEQLENGATTDDAPATTVAAPRPAGDAALRNISSPRLAAELQLRGWIVAEP